MNSNLTEKVEMLDPIGGEPTFLWYYKNFRMNTELHVAGNFIYDGISILNGISSTATHQTTNMFSFLYYISVGIERLQKLVIILLEEKAFDDESEIEKFYKKLKVHNHSELHQRITERRGLELEPAEESFLRHLADFYKKIRYGRYDFTALQINEKTIITEFLCNFLEPKSLERSCANEKDIRIDNRTKELFGRVIGSISIKYYGIVKEWCHKQEYQIYTYELQSGSKAEKVFATHDENSLQEQKVEEKNALRELIVFLRNAAGNNGFLKYLDNIQPISLDPELINEYIESLCEGNISQDLVDEVREMYAAESFGCERTDLISGIGNPRADFDLDDSIWPAANTRIKEF